MAPLNARSVQATGDGGWFCEGTRAPGEIVLSGRPFCRMQNSALAPRFRRSRLSSDPGKSLPPFRLDLGSSVTSRPLKGDAPTVDLVLGYKKSNQSPVLKLLLTSLDELAAGVSKKTH
jgi:hypothetical protein